MTSVTTNGPDVRRLLPKGFQLQLRVPAPDRPPAPEPTIVDPVVEIARRCAAGESLLTTNQLCRELGVSDREVRRWRHEDPPVPCVPVTAQRVRYFLADVLAWQQRRTAA